MTDTPFSSSGPNIVARAPLVPDPAGCAPGRGALTVRSMKMHALLTAAAVAGASIVVGTGLPAPAPVHAYGPGTMTDRLVLTFPPGTAPDVAQLSAAAGDPVSVLRRLDATRVLVEVPLPAAGSELSELARALEEVDGVLRVEPDIRLGIDLLPDDPGFSQQWHLNTPDPAPSGAANVTPAWDLTTGSAAVTIAVLDTGITQHSDLPESTILPGYDMVSDADTANDGDGRDADPADPGDWISAEDQSNPSFYGCGRSSSSWHGTHVTGIAAAAANNTTGIAGVAGGSRVLPVRVLGKCGGFTQDIADGIRWAAGLPVTGTPLNENPARVINMSLGGPSASCPTSLQSAITAARAAGSVVVVAAGNASGEASQYTPANCAGAVVVAAGEQKGGRAYYSNYGTVVDLLAPGSGIYSLINTGATAPDTEGLGFKSGTSMAAPVVAGVVALMISAHLPVPVPVLESRLTASTRTFPSLASLIEQYPGLYHQCGTSTCGAGVVDATAAVRSVHAPDAPGSPSGQGGEGTATITWTEPAYTGSSAISGYQVHDPVDNRTCFAPATEFSCTFTGLTGAVRTFTITATNEGGATSTATLSVLVQSPPRTTTTTAPPPTTTTTTPPTTTTTPPATTPPVTTTTPTLPPLNPVLAAPSDLSVRVDGDDLVVSASPVPGASGYVIYQGLQVYHRGADPLWRGEGRAAVGGVVMFTMVAVSPAGLQSLPVSTTFTVKPPKAPASLTTSVRRGVLTVRIRPATGTPRSATWCVYINKKQRDCSPVTDTSTSVRLPKGSHALQVRVFSSTGASAFTKSRTVRI